MGTFHCLPALHLSSASSPPSSTMSQTFSPSDVASHNKADNLWIIVDQDVYDLTKFQDEHPGGKKILQRVAGKDASKQFWKYHNESILKKYSKQLQAGSLDSKPKPAQQTPPTPSATPPPSAKKETEKVVPAPEPGAVSPQPGPAASEEAEAMDQYGDMIPYADPSWYQTYHTPYFNETHAALRAEVREWMEEEVMPYVTEWDEAKKVPDSIYKQMGERGYLAGLLGMHPYPSQLAGGKTIKSVPPEKWDLFHEMLLTDEMSRCGSGGFVWNVIGGFGIGCPPLVKHGKKELVQRVLPEILNGDKRICLAITEPDAGSDVANLTCEAKLSEDGKPRCVVLRNNIYHFRGRQGPRRKLAWKGEPRLQGRHDKLQPREDRHHHPVPALLPSLLRGVCEIRQQEENIRSEAHQPPRHPTQASTHGATDRSIIRLAGEPSLPMPEDGRNRSHAAAWRSNCRPQSTSNYHLRVLHQRGCTDLRWSGLLEGWSGCQDRASV